MTDLIVVVDDAMCPEQGQHPARQTGEDQPHTRRMQQGPGGSGLGSDADRVWDRAKGPDGLG